MVVIGDDSTEVTKRLTQTIGIYPNESVFRNSSFEGNQAHSKVANLVQESQLIARRALPRRRGSSVLGAVRAFFRRRA